MISLMQEKHCGMELWTMFCKPVDPEEFHKTFQRVMENISSKIEKKSSRKRKKII